MAETHYIIGGADGWLNIKREPSGQIVAVPEFLQVELTVSRDGRDYFTVLEGVERNKTFSVKAGHLKSDSPRYESAAHLLFKRRKKLLIYPGGRVNAFTDDENPILTGIHPIQIPDFPHSGGMEYTRYSNYAKTWFYLGHGEAIPFRNDRYLHAGQRTAGCITVDPGAWTHLYQYLILCRSNDGKTIGSVSVHA